MPTKDELMIMQALPLDLQEKFNEYVSTMDIMLDKVKNDFGEQLQKDDKVKRIEYTIEVTAADIALIKKTEKRTYQPKLYDYEEETRVTYLKKLKIEE